MKPKGVTLEQIFIKRLGVDFSKVKTIVDLGAWKGITPCWFAEKNPQAIVVAIEPIVENYIEMIKKIVQEGKLNIIPILTAISDKSGQEEIFLSERSVSHSFYIKNLYIDANRKRIISTISWDNLMELLNITEVDVAKVNIEGAEINLFKGMNKVFPKKMVVEEHAKCFKDKDFLPKLKNLIQIKGYKILEHSKSDLYLEYETKI